MLLAAVGMAALFHARDAGAQAIGINPSTPGDDALLVPSAEVTGHHSLRGALTFVQSSQPFRVMLPSLHSDSVVAQRSELVLGFGYTLWHRLLLGASVPAVVAQSGASAAPDSTIARAASGFALGDPKLTLRTFLLGTPRRRLGLSLEGNLWLPTGAADAFASDDRLRGGLSAIVGGRGPRHLWSLELGAQSRREQVLEGVVPYRMGHELVAGAAAQLAVDHSARLWVGSELRGYSTVTNGAKAFDPRSSRGVWLGSLSWRVGGSPLTLSMALGPGIGQGAGAGDWHALGRLAWVPWIEPPLLDADDDGIPDGPDACRDLAGVASEDPLMHGCPDLPKDEDGDGIPSALDACPLQAGPPSSVPSRHGCPKDAAPPEPAKPGPSATEPLAEVQAERIVIRQQVQFETGTAQLRPESSDVLSQVADILTQHAELELIEVQGHTDEVGTPDFNRRLSLDRARAVVRWLVEHGIVAERLVARGYGAEAPLATNATAAGRSLNRRVEFQIQKRANETEPAPMEGEP